MLMHLVPIFLKLKFTHRYILHNNCYIKSSVMYATLLQNKCFFSPVFEPQTLEVGGECDATVTTMPLLNPHV